MHVVFAGVQQEVSCVGEVEAGCHVDVGEGYADAFAGFLADAVDFEAFGFDFDVEDAACGLPVDGFVADWAVDEQGAVGFDD